MSTINNGSTGLTISGVCAVLFYVLYAGQFIYIGEPANLLWICHFGCFLAGAGMLLKRRIPLAMGFLWLSVGVPLWITAQLAGDHGYWSSFFTHVGGIATAGYGVWRMGMRRGSWIYASAGMVVMGVAARFLTPPPLNINLAFSVWKGWENMFHSHPLYVGFMIACCSVYFYLAETALRKISERLRAQIPEETS